MEIYLSHRRTENYKFDRSSLSHYFQFTFWITIENKYGLPYLYKYILFPEKEKVVVKCINTKLIYLHFSSSFSSIFMLQFESIFSIIFFIWQVVYEVAIGFNSNICILYKGHRYHKTKWQRSQVEVKNYIYQYFRH